ncbi:MAG: cation-transporting P-type ATPase [Methanomassiliicoccales archaeon]|nr:cation-transporting P-type ATPase [Methanomassiliicoccales archaeon]
MQTPPPSLGDESVDAGIPESADALHCIDCTIEQLYGILGTGPDGLSATEAAARGQRYGRNVLPERKKKLSQSLAAQLKNLFTILLIVAAILSFISGFGANDPSSIGMGIVILLVVVISVVFSLFQEYRAERAVRAIKELIPANARVRRDGQVSQVPVADVVPGDLLILEAGDKIPADARVVECFELAVDNSALTGESEPSHRAPGTATVASRKELAYCANVVFAGTTVASGSGTGVIFATGEHTEFGRIVKLTQTVVEPASPLQLEINRAARLNFVVAIVVGFVFLLIAFFGLGLELAASLLFMIGVMISLVPEGFQVTLTLSLALSSLSMSKRNVVVKRLSSVETLGSATVICTDKTGTITEGQMTVRKAWVGGRTLEATGEGYEPEGAVLIGGKRVQATDADDLAQLFRVSCLDNTATVVPPLDRRKSRWTAVGDSTEAALLAFAEKAGMHSKDQLARSPRIGMIPFESTRKMMTSVHREPDGRIVAYVKGAGAEILKRSSKLYWNGEVVPMTTERARAVFDQADAFAREAYRVLALAIRPLDAEPEKYESEVLEKDLTLVGIVAILDPPRAESGAAVAQARSAGVRVVMLTGDHELTAEAIAKSVGIITSSKGAVITGAALAKMSDQELAQALDREELVFARIAPDQKLRVVRSLREKGEVVAVTGDGVNDAPALLESDIGIAMGLSGTDVARESSDMVLLDDNFASIVKGIEQGRAVFDNLKKFIVYVFIHNWAELVAFIAFVVLGVPLPLAVVQVLAIDLMMDIPPSLALTLEPPEPDVMERPPRSKKSRLLGMNAIARSAYLGTVVGVFALFWCFSMWQSGGWTFGQTVVPSATVYAQGTTITVAAIMAGQLGAVFAMRTNVKSSLSVSLAKNKWLLVAVAISFMLLLLLVYVPAIGSMFMIAPVPLTAILVLYAIAPVVFVLEEMRKLILRRYLLPARPVAAVPIRVAMAGSVALPKLKELPPFMESAPPTAVVLRGIGFEGNLVHVAMDSARASGSRLVFIRAIDKETDDHRLGDVTRFIERHAAHLGVPYEMLDIHLLGRERGAKTMSSSLRKAVKESGAFRVFVPVSRDVLRGRRGALSEVRWVEDFRQRRVSMVSNWEAPFIPLDRGPRVLIPALTRLKGEPVELAEALTEGSVFPDVDIVAAKVVEIPPIVPLYSVYRPESLVDYEREISVFRLLPSWARVRRMHPTVVLVRETGRDLAQFAEERKVDVIVMEGEWEEKGRGFLFKKERSVAESARCTVVVAIPPEGS